MRAPAPTTRLGPPVRNGSTTVAGGLGAGAPRVAPPSARTSALARPIRLTPTSYGGLNCRAKAPIAAGRPKISRETTVRKPAGAISRRKDQRPRLFALATPAGFEDESRVAKQRDDSGSPTENRGSGSAKNRVVKVSGSKVAKLAAVASNAVRNFDLSRAIEVLEEMRRMGEGTR